MCTNLEEVVRRLRLGFEQPAKRVARTAFKSYG